MHWTGQRSRGTKKEGMEEERESGRVRERRSMELGIGINGIGINSVLENFSYFNMRWYLPYCLGRREILEMKKKGKKKKKILSTYSCVR